MSKPGPPLPIKTALLALVFCASAFLFVRETFARPPAPSPSGSPQTAAPQETIPQMVADIDRQLTPETFPLMSSAHAEELRAKLNGTSAPLDPEERLNTEMAYARELLNAGKTEESLREYAVLDKEVEKLGVEGRDRKADLLLQEGIGYLRLGEQQNCCANNNARSCLVPISGRGIHTKQYGSRHCIQRLTEALRQNPDNMAARWLLNIAYMTVGEYPQRVPSQWLIPLNKFGGDYPLPKFTNAAPDMGLDVYGWAGSVIMEDFEGNGLLDLLVSSFRPGTHLHYFRNNGDGTFTDRTKEAGLDDETGGFNMITTDYNNDGRPDVIILRGGSWSGSYGHYPLSLLRNDGAGHFTDVTIQAGLLTLGPSMTAVAFDYNGDGWLDLFVGYDSASDDTVPCKLFRNNGNGTFTDVTRESGLNIVRSVKGVVAADFLHTGRPGLYISCLGQPNILLRNDGPFGKDKSPTAMWKFTDISHQAGVDKQRSSFSTFCFDYDNDGWPDIYVGGYGGVRDVGVIARDYLGLPTTAQKAKLYRNNHDGTFTDVSNQAHLDKIIYGMGLNFGDLDNDGWLDFYVGTGNPELGTLTPARMFRNHNGKYFDEVTITGGFGHLQKGHGCAFGDLNNNGQQDVFMVMGGAVEGDTAHSCLYINPGNKNHWVTLKLEGVKSNRIALGAEICVTVATPQGERKIYRTVSTGGSFGCSPLRQEIGLGDATAIQQVQVRWPASGATQTVRNVGMDGFYKLREGDSEAQTWKVPTFKLPHQGARDFRALRDAPGTQRASRS